MSTWMFSASTGEGFLPSPVDPKNKQTQTRMSEECQLALVCVHEEYNDIGGIYKQTVILEVLDSSCHKPEPIQISLEINDFSRKSIDHHRSTPQPFQSSNAPERPAVLPPNLTPFRPLVPKWWNCYRGHWRHSLPDSSGHTLVAKLASWNLVQNRVFWNIHENMERPSQWW